MGLIKKLFGKSEDKKAEVDAPKVSDEKPASLSDQISRRYTGRQVCGIRELGQGTPGVGAYMGVGVRLKAKVR